MKITDNKRTIDIQIRRWNADSWNPGWGGDCSEALIDESFHWDDESQAWVVDDVQDVIDYAEEQAAIDNAAELDDPEWHDAHPGEWCVLWEDI